MEIPAVAASSGDSGQSPAPAFERTLALIKPDAFDRAVEIENIMQKEGFSIRQRRKVHLTPSQASEFYAAHYGKSFFPFIVEHMSSGPLYAYCLMRVNAIQHWINVLGPANVQEAKRVAPNTIRAKFGKPSQDSCNAAHGSDCLETANKELQFFFPEITLEPLLNEGEAVDYLVENVNPTLTKGLVELCKKKPQDPITWLADWLTCNNPNKPIMELVVNEKD